MAAYYNEFDKKAAAWLRELIKAGHIADGDVDERSIEDVVPSELTGYTQCHFFAGIGVWSYALRQAGWPDDRPVWTGSCPCQPFSAAGKGGGFDDERHLWPAFHHLISQCRPSVVFGEQVASKDGLAWLDLVQADLEGTGYAVGAVDTCAAGFGAPHIRQRLYWVADAQSAREQRESGNPASTGSQGNEGVQEYGKFGSISGMADAASDRRREGQSEFAGCASGDGAEGTIRRIAQFGVAGSLDNSVGEGLERFTRNARNGNEPRRHEQDEARSIAKASPASWLANAAMHGYASTARPAYFRQLEQQSGRQAKPDECVKLETECHTEFGGLERAFPGPTNGFWGNADWLFCRDNKWRSVESGSFPLVNGAPARVGRLRGYGNAIVAPVAQAFIEAYLDIRRD